MIEDQHAVPISMFPMDMKCRNHHQPLPPPAGTGNERMLTSNSVIQSEIVDPLADVSSLIVSNNSNVIGNRILNQNNMNNMNINNSNNNNNSNNSSNSNNGNNNSHMQSSGIIEQIIARTTTTPTTTSSSPSSSSPLSTSTSSSALSSSLSGCCNSTCIDVTNNCNGRRPSTLSLLQLHQSQQFHHNQTNHLHHNPHHNHHHNHHNLQHQHQLQQQNLQHQHQQQQNQLSTMATVLAANGANQCGYCCQPICDRYIMRVVETSYHEGCLKCSSCSMHLVHSCFTRNGKLYCRLDYERLFIRNRCLGCGDKISCDELVMRTLENVFHLKCFACVVCGIQLKKGEQYVVKQGQLFCRFDYEKEVEMLQGYEDFYGDDLFPPKLDGRRGPKRPRTILNTQQRRAFKASFEVSPKPCRKVRENLAKETGLSLRIVQVWFQNQRAKVKKIQKKAKQEQKGASETDSQESDSSLAKIKDENQSDSESLESPYSMSEKVRLVKEEIQTENLPFNCTETNKENCNKTNEPILNTILGLSYATFQQLMGPFGQSQMLNPIDRLYSMQNSYFRPEELSFAECKDNEN